MRDHVFCDCESGQHRERYYERRVNGTATFVADTNAANENARLAKHAAAITHQKQRLNSAGVPDMFAHANLLDFITSVGTDPNKRDGIEAAQALLDDGKVLINGISKNSLLLYGASRGTGKTTLATSIYRKWVLDGKQGIWLTFSQFLMTVKNGYGNSTAYERIMEAQTVDVLLFDDIGDHTRQDLTPHQVEVMGLIIYYRHMYSLPTLMTSNLMPSGLRTQFKESTWQRIGQMSAVIPFAGQVLRPY